jgi:hypothetical protein
MMNTFSDDEMKEFGSIAESLADVTRNLGFFYVVLVDFARLDVSILPHELPPENEEAKKHIDILINKLNKLKERL